MSNESKSLELALDMANDFELDLWRVWSGSEVAAELRRQHAEIESLRAQLAQRVPDGCVVADVGFRWDAERQHHVPKLVVEFEPVPANSPCDAKGWKDRDAVAAMLSAAPSQQAPDAQECEWTNCPRRVGDVCCNEQQAPVAQGEPVAWKHDCAALLQNDVELWVARCPHCGKPRDTHPQQASEPMTPEQINLAWDRSCLANPTGAQQRFVFARAVELHHKIGEKQ